MSNVIIKTTAKQIEKMKQTYSTFYYQKSSLYIFCSKKSGTTITAYTSGKVMFQGTNAEKEAGRWGEAQSAAKK